MVKPTKMRNRQIYRASQSLRSKQVSANLSKGLRSKYSRRSIRVVEGDTVMIKRGEYADVPGKVEKIDIASGRISVAGVKKEKAKGDKFDVMIHASNVLVTGLNLGDQRRRDKIGATGEYETDETVAETGAATATAAATATDGTPTADGVKATPDETGDGGEDSADDEDVQAIDSQDGDRDSDAGTGGDADVADDSDGEDNEGSDAGDDTDGDRDGNQGNGGGQADKTKQNRPGDEA